MPRTARALTTLTTAGLLAGLMAAPGAHATATTADDVLKAVPSDMAFSGPDLIVLGAGIRDGALDLNRVTPAGVTTPIALPDAVAGGDTNDFDGPFLSELQASGQAVAVSASSIGPDDVTNSYVGPAAGPLRAVASCPDRPRPLAVAVDGARVAWIEGGCEQDGGGVTDATVVIGAADPAAPTQRIPLPAGARPAGLTLGPAGDRVAYDASPRGMEQGITVAPLTADGLGAPLGSFDGGAIPFGLLGTAPGGVTLLDDEGLPGESAGCANHVRRIAAGSTAAAPLTAAGCLVGDDRGVDLEGATRSVALAPNRLVTLALAPGSRATSPKRVVRSTPLAGGTPTTLLTARGRLPRQLTADDTRIAYVLAPCAERNGQPRAQLVVSDGQVPAIADCTLTLRGTTIRRTEKGYGTIAARCPRGCSVDSSAGKRIGLGERAFTATDEIRKGSGRLRVPVPTGTKPGARIAVFFTVDDGRRFTARLRVR